MCDIRLSQLILSKIVARRAQASRTTGTITFAKKYCNIHLPGGNEVVVVTVVAIVVGGPVVIGGAWVVVGGCVVLGGADVVVGGLVVVGGGCVVIGGAVVVEGGLVILGIKGSLHNVVLQQLTEQDTMEPPRTAFSKPHCWFWLQKSGGKHPTLKMGLFWTVSNAWSVRHVKFWVSHRSEPKRSSLSNQSISGGLDLLTKMVLVKRDI